MARDTDHCSCGHDRRAHEHLRRGTDCALCVGCARFSARADHRVRAGGTFAAAALTPVLLGWHRAAGRRRA